jgi:hypothetical protein
LLLFTPQKQQGRYWTGGLGISFGLYEYGGEEKEKFSGDCLQVNEPSGICCHVNEFVMENLKPLRIIRARRRAVFLASSRPQ